MYTLNALLSSRVTSQLQLRTFITLTCDSIRGTQRFVSGNICSGDVDRLRNSDIIPVRTRDFFGETSPQTFVTRGVIKFHLFSEGQICRLGCRIRSASIFGELSAARKFGG